MPNTLFMDGDCVAHPDFVKEHLVSANPGHYLNGAMVRLSPRLTDSIDQDAHLIRKAGYTKTTAQTGAVTLIQRFGGALNLNIHFHMIFLDGIYGGINRSPVRFRWVKAPTKSVGRRPIAITELTRENLLDYEDGILYLYSKEKRWPLAHRP